MTEPFNVGFLTDVGRRRSQNQDSGLSLPDLGLFLVADGMGGHQGGETASRLAVQIISDELRQLHRATTPLKGQDGQEESLTLAKRNLSEAIHRANLKIYETSLENRELRGMGTTATALFFVEGKGLIGHVGDSRCYLVRKQQIWQLTRDHSLVQEKLRAGLINREQLKSDRTRNVITRSVGFERQVYIDLYEIDVREGDIFLLCSDGLSGPVEEASILAILKKIADGKESAVQGVTELVHQANENGGEDNITALAVKIDSLAGWNRMGGEKSRG